MRLVFAVWIRDRDHTIFPPQIHSHNRSRRYTVWIGIRRWYRVEWADLGPRQSRFWPVEWPSNQEWTWLWWWSCRNEWMNEWMNELIEWLIEWLIDWLIRERSDSRYEWIGENETSGTVSLLDRCLFVCRSRISFYWRVCFFSHESVILVVVMLHSSTCPWALYSQMCTSLILPSWRVKTGYCSAFLHYR